MSYVQGLSSGDYLLLNTGDEEPFDLPQDNNMLVSGPAKTKSKISPKKIVSKTQSKTQRKTQRKSSIKPLRNPLIKKYIENIINFLGEKYCFTSGAFVIEDTNDYELKTLLNSVQQATPLFFSHTLYKKKGDPMTEIHLHKDDKITAICHCNEGKKERRDFVNIKWYAFKQKNKNFIYLKLEDTPSFSLKHAWNAIIPNRKSCVKTRREDCPENCAVNKKTKIQDCSKRCRYLQGNNYDPQKPFEMPSLVSLNNETSEIEPDTYTREGDEVFIPSALNEYFLENINETLVFDNTVPDFVKISKAAAAIKGGNRKHKVTRRKRALRKGKRRSTRRKRRNVK